ncbi:exportin-6-like isoform X2 [Corticium candelabrum]|uniref:exportin-6-like isoform X2 n=1 Tax=Corticium candelabrum TaxID=121492 RepID=UPI002E377BA9|nr:exportin-6-like isoform X2 [Corticium candelabrum]
MSEVEYLRGLEGLLNELFSQDCSNERKREIEQILSQFQQQSGSWRYCLYFLKQSRNHFVLMFALKVLEDLVNKMWASVVDKDRLEVRQFLLDFVMWSHGSMLVENYIQKKAIKVVVDIGRADWPHKYPEFFISIIQLIQDPDKCSLGLVMALTASEELATPREDLSMARKEELHKLLLEIVPKLLAVTLSVLERIADRQRQTVAETPPSSPDRLSQAISCDSSIKFQLPASQQERKPPHHYAPLDVRSEELSNHALECLVHVFSWVPLATALSPSLLTTIFHFATVGCEIGVNAQSSSCANLGSLAMSCINELVSKHQIPIEYEDFLVTLFVQTFNLLERITEEVIPGSNASGEPENLLRHLEDSYIEKFSELLRVFVSNHLRRVESSGFFSIHDFLSLLYKYTFKQPLLDGFFMSLEIWDAFLDYIIGKTASPNWQASVAGTHDQYKEVVLSLVDSLLKKAQFQYNSTELQDMENEGDAEQESEWQHFVSRILDIAAKAAELYADEVIHMMLAVFSNNVSVYEGIHHLITENEQGQSLQVATAKDAEQLHTALRDLTTSIQALGSVVDHFIGDQFMNRYERAYALVDKLCKVVLYSTQHALFVITTPVSELIQPALQDVHAQGLATLRTYCHWLSQFYVETARRREHEDMCAGLIVQEVDAIASVLDRVAPETVHMAAAALLVSLCTTVRPHYILSMKPLQLMLKNAASGSLAALPYQAQLLTFKGLSSALVIPWPELADTDQQWDARAAEHEKLLKGLSQQFRLIHSVESFVGDRDLQGRAPFIKRALAILTEILDAVKYQGTKSKLIVFQAVRELMESCLVLFTVYIRQPDVIDSIMTFLLILCDSLKVQVGPKFIEKTIQTIMSLFTSEQMCETVVKESENGCRVIERFLRLLQVVVQEQGRAFKGFLPNIIAFCMEQIHPLVAHRDVPDINSVMFELLQDVLVHHWRHFFPTSVLQKVRNSSSLDEPIDNEGQFMVIMKAIGESLLRPDITFFKQNLTALENLNSKWRLYHKAVIRGGLLAQLLSVLLHVLVKKSHDLLREEITVALHNMAAVDFDHFYRHFLPHFLWSELEGLTDTQREELAKGVNLHKDLPTFTQTIHRLTSDVRYYVVCNSSLPAGSVKL